MRNFIICLTTLFALTSCEMFFTPNISSEDVMPLLDSGRVKYFGVGHSGIFTLTTHDGEHFSMRYEDLDLDFRDFDDLLSQCANCENTSYWIE
jgi:hypothetical protein